MISIVLPRSTLSLENTYDMHVSTSLTWSTCSGLNMEVLRLTLTLLQASALFCASKTSEVTWSDARLALGGRVIGCAELFVTSTGIRQIEPLGDSLTKPGVTSRVELCYSLSSGSTTSLVTFPGQECVNPQRTTV